MEFIGNTSFDFMGRRKLALICSAILIIIGVASLFTRGLNWGIEFTGGTLVQVAYENPVQIKDIRDQLADVGLNDAVVQYFGTSRDISIRLPVVAGETTAQVSTRTVEALRAPFNEILTGQSGGQVQQCVSANTGPAACQLQMRRIEFIGPQFGEELAENGGLAMLTALFLIMLYVAFRFEWKFSIGSVAALAHDVLITIGIFSLLQMEFTQPVLAAILAVIGYSLNDTIVVFDRIRENFRKMRKGTSIEIMNKSINQTLRRTVLTSVTTLLVLLALFFLGGEVIRGFAVALIIGVLVGTYSSIFIASPVVLTLGLSREDMMLVKKEGADHEQVVP
jgi:preprotein translocase subunit SecF